MHLPDNPVLLEENEQLKLAFDFVQNTHMNVFLTGNAGTGKTTFLHNLKKNCYKRMVVVAPTGVAAINAGGVTIHSFFQLPFGPNVPVDLSQSDEFQQDNQSRIAANAGKFNREKINIIKSLDLLVIDEISMVRADLLDGIDEVLRRFRNRQNAFGGVQLLMIGDMHQLAPVVKNDDWDILKHHYETAFFFSSKALQKTDYVCIELKHIFRQSDRHFVSILNRIRKNDIDFELLTELNERYIPNVEKQGREGYIILTTHNAKAKEVNEMKLNDLPSKKKSFTAEIKGDFPDYSFPTEAELELKEGAQVMFVKNDSSPLKRYFNGKIGKIIDFEDEYILVDCPNDEAPIEVGREVWENVRYEIDEESQSIKENVIGQFVQYPLKLAWAITIHKSQGLTFDKAIIDARLAFAFGQVYVALSRCRSLEGLLLSSKITFSSIKTDPHISQFSNKVEENLPGNNILEESKKAFREMLLKELFDYSTLQRRLNYLIKVLHENTKVIQPELLRVCKEASDKLQSEINEVSAKFNQQLDLIFNNGANQREEEFLQSRVKKAAVYFYEKTDVNLKNRLSGLEVDIDNKVLKKTVSDILLKINEEVYIKLACLKACFDSFRLPEFLDVRAKASIQKAEIRSPVRKTDIEKTTAMNHPGLYSALKRWRNATAEKMDVPVYMILPLAAMNAISETVPSSMKELKKVPGLGPKKLKKYGEEIFRIISEYRKKIFMDVEEYEEYKEEEKLKKEKGKSFRLSYEMFRKGMSVAEIARERQMAVSTIEGHLALFVRSGELKVEELVAKDKIHFIAEWFLKMKDINLGRAKNALGDAFSYAEIRMVLNSLIAEGKVKG